MPSSVIDEAGAGLHGHVHACATVSIRADGAGIYKQPPNVSYTNKYIPTIVAATHPTQTHTINLLGHDITITLKATNYEWDWATAPHTPSPPTGPVRKLLTVCLCGCCPGRLV